MALDLRDCVVYWACPSKRLFACEYGLFEWNAISAMMCPGYDCDKLALKLSSPETRTKVCITSLDGERVTMLYLLVDTFTVYFEVIQHRVYGGRLGGDRLGLSPPPHPTIPLLRSNSDLIVDLEKPME
jgi:hypothetical protein